MGRARAQTAELEAGGRGLSPRHAHVRCGAAKGRALLTKATFDRIQIGEMTVEQAITSGDLKIEGQREALGELVGLFDRFPFWFNIVTA